MTNGISQEDLKRLLELHTKAENTPVISLTGKPEDDWSQHAWVDFKEFQKELGKKYNYDWKHIAINEKGEMIAV